MKLKRTNSKDPDFRNLVTCLDNELGKIDGDEHHFYDQYNKIDTLKYVLVLYLGENAVGCGAIKEYDERSMEVKRMYVLDNFRGKGYSSKILFGLESWAKELGYERTVLETGKRQISAVKLYVSKGYEKIENYGQYRGVENSICFKKELKP